MDPSQSKSKEMSITAQVVLLHPSFSTNVYWVLNREEQGKCTQIYGTTPKPAGWGNPGGGVDPDVDGIDKHGHARVSSEEITRAGAQREVEDETGFHDLYFIPYQSSRVPFLIRPYEGHCIVTFVAKLNNFSRYLPVKEEETGEIIRGGWFDLSISPIDIFRPDAILPYRSHIQRTIICFNMMARIMQPRKYVPINPLWKLVFPVGNGDPRFPSNGYSLPIEAWKNQMRDHIRFHRRAVNIEGIYEQYRHEIDVARDSRQDKPPAPPQPVVIADTAALDEDAFLREVHNRKLLEQEQAWREFGEKCARDRA